MTLFLLFMILKCQFIIMTEMAEQQPEDTKKLRKLLCEELNSMSADLGNIFKTKSAVLESFSRELFAKQVISSDVNDNPSFESIRSEFESSMKFMDSTHEIERHCIVFLQALEQAGGTGGPTTKAAGKLEEQWTNVVLTELHISFIRKSSHETTDQSNDQYMHRIYLDNLQHYQRVTCNDPSHNLPPSPEKLRYFIQNHPRFYGEVLEVISTQLKSSPISTEKKMLKDIWAQQLRQHTCSARQPGKRKRLGNSESNSSNYAVEPSQVSQPDSCDGASESTWINSPPYTYANREYMTDPSVNYDRLSHPSQDDFSTHSSDDAFFEGYANACSKSVPQSRSSPINSSRKTSSASLSSKSLGIDKLKIPPPEKHQLDENVTPRPDDFIDTQPAFVKPQQSQINEEDIDADDVVNEMVRSTQPPILASTVTMVKEDRPLINEVEQLKAEVNALKLANETLTKRVETLGYDLQKVQQENTIAMPEEKDSIICKLQNTITSQKQRKREKIAELKKQHKEDIKRKTCEYWAVITIITAAMLIANITVITAMYK